VSRLARTSTAIATALAIVGLAVALLLTPLYVHAVLASADSAVWLGVTPGQAEALSDRTIVEMVFGPATFEFLMPSGAPRRFYDDAEASHLRDARVVLYGLAVAVLVAIVMLAVGVARRRHDPRFWRSIARGAGTLAVAFAVIGAIFLFAFDAAFTLFHEIFFPGGNWSFDPATERLVQLYPVAFWQLTTTVLGALVIGIGAAVWYLARRYAAALERATGP
jgi:integral membrane protein (TIGR01906 family)